MAQLRIPLDDARFAKGLPWKDYFFLHPSRAGKLPDGVFKARMAA